MVLFHASEKIEFLASQCLHYDRYVDCQWFLERVDVNGKYGLVCEELSEHGTHAKVLLEPVYDEIEIRRISHPKAIYNKYAVFANEDKVGEFTLVLNAWVPVRTQNN